MSFQTGQVINSRYRVVKLLAVGGYGTIYRAWDTVLNTACALKENLDQSTASQNQFIFEAKLLAQLSHQNLPRVSDHFIIPGQGQFLVMDFIEGEDLETLRCQNGGALPEAQVLPWIQQVCDALIYLHNQNPPIIHRDIKPANIRITPQGQAVLVDFGIAKQRAGDNTATGAKAITPGYSPPEQYTGAGTDERSDVYALGATLYTLLTGIVLPESIDRMISKTGTQPPLQVRPGIQPHVSQAIMRSIQADKTLRFDSIAEFRDALLTRHEGCTTASWKKAYIIPIVLVLLVAGWFLRNQIIPVTPAPISTPTKIAAINATPTKITAINETPTYKPSLTATIRVTNTQPPVKTRPPTLTPEPVVVSSWRQGRLAFPVRMGGRNALHLFDMENNRTEEILPANQGEGLLSAPVFSPDGSNLAFHYYLGNLFVMKASKNSAPIPLRSCAAASWSPDGNQILCNVSGNSTFEVIHAGTGRVDRTFNVSDQARIPAWSPTGEEFAFVTLPGNATTAIYRKSLVDDSLPVLLSGSTSENYAPAYSPDGQWIAFQSNINSSLSEVWIMDRNGQNKRRITNTPSAYWSRAPAWSPDGKWLAFVSNQAGSAGEDYGEVFVVSLESGEVEQITNTGGIVYDWRVSWGK